jgi:hypothetical protein
MSSPLLKIGTCGFSLARSDIISFPRRKLQQTFIAPTQTASVGEGLR